MKLKFKVVKTELNNAKSTAIIFLGRVLSIDSYDRKGTIMIEIDQLNAKDYVVGTVIEVSFDNL